MKTYDKIQEILMEARLQTGKAAQPTEGLQLTESEVECLAGVANWNWDNLTQEQINAFLKSK